MNQTCQTRSYRPEARLAACLAASPSMRQRMQMPEASMSLAKGLSQQGGQVNCTVFQVVDGITETRGGPI
jgi:hypothetical protein